MSPRGIFNKTHLSLFCTQIRAQEKVDKYWAGYAAQDMRRAFLPTSLHPLRLCRLHGLCLSLHWMLSFLFCLFALSACACSSEVTVTSISPTSFVSLLISFAVFQYSPIRSRGRLPVGLGSSNKIPCNTNQRSLLWSFMNTSRNPSRHEGV